MTRLSWTEAAVVNLEHIRRYVTAFQPEAAQRLACRIEAAAAALAADPAVASGEIGERPVVYPYVLRYRLIDERIVVMAVRRSESARIV